MSDFYSFRISTARKPHTCSLCGQEIPKGETYARRTGKWCGDFYSNYFHLSCQDLVEKYCYESREEEWYDYCIYDWLYEECCMNCSKKDECESNVFRCDKVLNQIFKRGIISDC